MWLFRAAVTWVCRPSFGTVHRLGTREQRGRDTLLTPTLGLRPSCSASSSSPRSFSPSSPLQDPWEDGPCPRWLQGGTRIFVHLKASLTKTQR